MWKQLAWFCLSFQFANTLDGQYSALSSLRRSFLHYKCHPKWLFTSQQAPLNIKHVTFCLDFDFYLSLIFLRCSSGKNIIRVGYIGHLCNPVLWSQHGQMRKRLWIKWLAQVPYMCFWVSALWLNAILKLSCQNRLTSLSPAALLHMQVWLSILVLWTSQRWQVVGDPVLCVEG